MKGDTSVINGVKMDDISLNSSRSRRRRDSHGSPKHQRRSIHAENGTEDFRRVSSAASMRELSKSQDREQTVNLRNKGRENNRLSDGNKKDNKRASSIVLDVNSILDELVGGDDDGKSNRLSAEQKSPVRTPSPILHVERAIPKRRTPSPLSMRSETSAPAEQPKKSRALETTVTRSSRLVRNGLDDSRTSPGSSTSSTTTTSTYTSSQVSDKRPPIAPTKKMSSPGRLRGPESTSSRNTVTSPTGEKSVAPRTQSPDLKEDEKELLNKQSSSLKSRKVYPNGTTRVSRSELDEEEIPSYYRSRTRSNAISKSDTQQYSPKINRESQLNEEEPPPSPRLREKSKRRSHIDSIAEMRPERSGSWNRMRQLVNSKALGMFYHNRRSQALDHESVEDGDSRGSSVERSDSSTSTPHSPTLLSPRSRESRSFSPSVKSPLASKQKGFDEAHASLADKKEREEGSAAPTTPSTPSKATTLAPPRIEQDEEEPQVTTGGHLCVT